MRRSTVDVVPSLEGRLSSIFEAVTAAMPNVDNPSCQMNHVCTGNALKSDGVDHELRLLRKIPPTPTLQTTPRSSRSMSTAWPVCSISVQTSARCSFGELRSAAKAARSCLKERRLRSRAAPLGAALREELSLERVFSMRKECPQSRHHASSPEPRSIEPCRLSYQN